MLPRIPRRHLLTSSIVALARPPRPAAASHFHAAAGATADAWPRWLPRDRSGLSVADNTTESAARCVRGTPSVVCCGVATDNPPAPARRRPPCHAAHEAAARGNAVRRRWGDESHCSFFVLFRPFNVSRLSTLLGGGAGGGQVAATARKAAASLSLGCAGWLIGIPGLPGVHDNIALAVAGAAAGAGGAMEGLQATATRRVMQAAAATRRAAAAAAAVWRSSTIVPRLVPSLLLSAVQGKGHIPTSARRASLLVQRPSLQCA